MNIFSKRTTYHAFNGGSKQLKRNIWTHFSVKGSVSSKRCETCMYRNECFPTLALESSRLLESANFYNHAARRRVVLSAGALTTLFGMSMSTKYLYHHGALGDLKIVHGKPSSKNQSLSKCQTAAGGHDCEWEHNIPNMGPAIGALYTCACGCGRETGSSVMDALEVAGGRVWMKSHFKCSSCGKELQGKMKTSVTKENSSPSSQKEGEEEDWVFVNNDGKLYCCMDYVSHFCHHCSCCGASLEHGDFLLDPKWGTATCEHCLTAPTGGNLHHESVFMDSSSSHKCSAFDGDGKDVVDEANVDVLVEQVRLRLSNLLGMNDFLNETVPVAVISENEMASLCKRKASQTQPLGLTIKHPIRMFDLLQKESFNDHSWPSIFSQFIKPWFSQKHYKPTKVVILKGQSQIQAGAVLAHELTHVWLASNIIKINPNLPLDVEEGLCELFAYLWLMSIQEKEKEEEEENQKEYINNNNNNYCRPCIKETVYHLQRMENNEEPQRGLSFHRAFHSLQGRSLRQVLTYVRDHQDFPPPL